MNRRIGIDDRDGSEVIGIAGIRNEAASLEVSHGRRSPRCLQSWQGRQPRDERIQILDPVPHFGASDCEPDPQEHFAGGLASTLGFSGLGEDPVQIRVHPNSRLSISRYS